MQQQSPPTKITWMGMRANVFDGPLSSLVEELPQFSRVPFLMDRYENPRTDLIARLPLHRNEPVVPLAMVSKGYALIQHHEVVWALGEALETFEIQARGLSGRLTLSEFGERMYLRLVLPEWTFAIAEPRDVMAMQVHCLNSVDRSMSLQIRLGWYRFICSNGMFFGEEAASLRRTHTTGLNVEDIAAVLREQLEHYDDERQTLERWHRLPVSLEQVHLWVDGPVNKRWGVYAAARVWHMATTGYDGTVQRVQERIKPSAYQVSSDVRVPGMPEATKNVFDASQILSWLATHHDNVQGQLERTGDVRTLIEDLIG